MFPSVAFDFNPQFVSKSAWHKHMPFAYHLTCELNPKLLVELGVHRGDSYFTFCQSCKENKLSSVCYGVDLWCGDAHSGVYGNGIYEQVNSYNASHYASFSYLIKSSFDEACSQFDDNSIQLLHIDGLHTYEAVKSDFETWFSKVEEHGIVLLHDVRERKPGFGVWKLWEELKEQYPSFLFDYGSGLGVLQKGQPGQSIRISDRLVLDSSDAKGLQESYLKAFELMNLRLRLNAKQVQLEKSESDLNCASHKQVISMNKIESIHSSFSWKVTAPLRSLRRAFLDPFFKNRRMGFDPVAYLELNPDLSRVVGSDLEAATSHFYNFGLKQGRRFKRRKRRSYGEWAKSFDTITDKTLSGYAVRASRLSSKPLLSIIMPVFNPPASFLEDAIESVLDQVYQNWELCIVNDASTLNHVSEILSEYAAKDPRIKVEENETNRHISASSNRAVKMAMGDFLALMDHDDLLRPHSLLRVVETINEDAEVEIVYSDEDKIDQSGKRSQPYFKPDWNPDLLFSQNYLCHFLAMKKKLVLQAGGFREGFEGSQDWDLALRACHEVSADKIVHIPEILYHWRIHESSVSSGVDAKDYAVDAAKKSLEDTVRRNKIDGDVEIVQEQYLRLKRRIKSPNKKPLVSIIIPTRDNARVLQRCLETLRERTLYENYEVLIIDNDSKDPATLEALRFEDEHSNQNVLSYHGAFNYSAINNFAADKADGECLVLLNDDIEIIEEEWLEELLVHALREEIGAVGCKLFYPDGAIQHAGILIGYCGVAGEIGKGLPNDFPGQMQRANLVQNVSAVTGACLAIAKSKYHEVGGLDEKNLKVAFNDVDFCLRLLEAGYRNLYTPFATLIHHESLTRGRDDTPAKKARFVSEADYMKEKWRNYIRHDPAYNPNLSLKHHQQFEAAFPPRSK
tara:strand:+ start:3457 stop:6180 length:2724 start_codon:yes stop_codon:yes gene_type:complete